MRYVLLFLVGLLSTTTFCQVPDYLNNYPEWRIDQQIDTEYPCVPTHHYTVYTNGDSTIGAFTYKKIYRHGITEKMYYGQPPIGDPNFDCYGTEIINDFVGLVRQENNRFYEYSNGQEFLMYDFDLVIGQSTPVTSVGNSGGWTVTSIDSILINGNYHKQFFINNGSIDSSFIIEGVGSRAGLFEPFNGFFENDAFLICYAQNGTTYFSTVQDCQYDVNVDELTAIDISIFPQPAQANVTISIKDRIIDRVEVLSSQGTLISAVNGGIKKVELDVSSLSPSLYHLRIFSDQSVLVKKLVIH